MEILGMNIWIWRIIFLILGVILSIQNAPLVMKMRRMKGSASDLAVITGTLGLTCALGLILGPIFSCFMNYSENRAPLFVMFILWIVMLVLVVALPRICSKALEKSK